MPHAKDDVARHQHHAEISERERELELVVLVVGLVSTTKRVGY